MMTQRLPILLLVGCALAGAARSQGLPIDSPGLQILRGQYGQAVGNWMKKIEKTGADHHFMPPPPWANSTGGPPPNREKEAPNNPPPKQPPIAVQGPTTPPVRDTLDEGKTTDPTGGCATIYDLSGTPIDTVELVDCISNALTMKLSADAAALSGNGIFTFPTGLEISPDSKTLYAGMNRTSIGSNGQDVQLVPYVSVIPVAGTPPVGIVLSPGVIKSIQLSSDGGVLYAVEAANRGAIPGAANAVSVSDTSSSKIVATIPLPGEPTQGVLIRDGSLLYVQQDDTTMTVVDTMTRSVAGNFSTRTPGLGSFREPFAIDTSGRYAYMAASNKLGVVDLATQTLLGTISGFQSISAVAVSWDGSLAAVADFTANSLFFVDTTARAILSQSQMSNDLQFQLGSTLLFVP